MMMSDVPLQFMRSESGDVVYSLNQSAQRAPSEYSIVDPFQSEEAELKHELCSCRQWDKSNPDENFRSRVDRRSFSWMYDWLLPIADLERLDEQEPQNEKNLETIRKIRVKLHHLQITMPSWTLWDSLAKCYLLKKRESFFKDFDSAVEYVTCNSTYLLCSLYKDLWLNEQELYNDRRLLAHFEPCSFCTEQAKRFAQQCILVGGTVIKGKDVEMWFRQLYSDKKIVGPLGERPLQSCLLRAKHFLEKDEAMYAGMVEGAKRFVNLISQFSAVDEINVGFGKDYCAAVGSYIYNEQNEAFKAGHERLSPPDWDTRIATPPYWKTLTEWTSKHTELKPHTTLDHRLKAMLVAEANYDSKLSVSNGIYEGEAGIFFMIAAKNVAMVQWLLENGASPTKKLQGLFFRPRNRHWIAARANMEWAQFWTATEYNTNSYASSSDAYFGLNPLGFAASQGSQQESVEIMELILNRIEEIFLQDERLLVKDQMLNRTWLHVLQTSRTESERCIASLLRKAILNQRDEFGNSLLHLAALNGSKKVFQWLIDNGADPDAVNHDGLSPLSLTVIFSLWDMFNFIRQTCLSTLIWQSGYLRCEQRDYSHIDTTRNLQDKVAHEMLIMRLGSILRSTVHAAAGKKMSVVDENARVVDRSLKNLKSSDLVQYYLQKFKNQEMLEFLTLYAGFDGADGCSANFVKGPFVSVIEAIMLSKPEGWSDATKECFPDIVLRKWFQFYWMLHLGSFCIPYAIVFVLYGLMWYFRQLTIRENSGLEGFLAPAVHGVEAGCGWPAIRDSISGRIQAVLAVYGALTLVRVAYFHRHLRVTNLYANGYNPSSPTKGDYPNFIYLNMESLMCIIVCSMFIAPGAARVMGGEECDSFFLDVEKNATAIAGLFLCCNLLNVLRPVKFAGRLLSTIYLMLVTDLFNFVVLYMSTFAGFLLAIQTLHNAGNHLLVSVIESVLNESTGRRKVGGSSGISSLDPLTCESRVMTLSDTAFKLLTVSLGDGFTDILEASRSTQDSKCGGYRPDRIYVVLYFGWILITNILQLNLFIAMLTKTFDTNVEKSDCTWKLDVCSRVYRYEKQYPDLLARSQRSKSHNAVLSRAFLFELLVDVGIVIYCIPEVRWAVRTSIFFLERLRSGLTETSDESLVRDLVNLLRNNLKCCPVPAAAKCDFWSRLGREQAVAFAKGMNQLDGIDARIRPRLLANAISRLDHQAKISSRLVVGPYQEKISSEQEANQLDRNMDEILTSLKRLENLNTTNHCLRGEA